MKTIVLNFYTDPGHGWVKIAKSKLVKLGIADKISSYSYMRKDFAYLEEDYDASLLIASLKEKGFTFTVKEHVAREKSSKIRSYDCYHFEG
jgi:hypothetical protein